MPKNNSAKPNNSQTLNKQRRHFIKGAGAAFVGMGAANVPNVLASEKLTKSKTPGCDYDVIVIGGGFAGTAAARDSKENGYHTLLIEARNRLGGRTFTSEFDGHKVELGGAWIHPSQPFVWAEKERYAMAVEETPGANPEQIIALENGKPKSLNLDEFYASIGAFEEYISQGRTVVPRTFDLLHNKEAALAADKISAQAHLDQMKIPSYAHQVIDGFIGASAGSEGSAISYLEVLRLSQLAGGSAVNFMDSGSRFKLTQGTDKLIENIINDAKPEVKLSNPVKHVEDLGDKVRVTTVRGEVFTAASIIVALPMNVLPSVKFTPALDPKLAEAATQGHAGKGIKQYIKLKGNYGKVFCATKAKDSPYSVMGAYEESADHTLMVAFGNKPQNGFDPNDDEAVAKAVKAFLPDAEVVSSFSYDWNIDPYSKGMYCLYPKGWVAKYNDHFAKDTGRIFFGQGDHGEGWRGYIDGAIGAGIRAAQRVKGLLG